MLGKTNRNKRGLINGIGSILKTLFGTLTESDLTYVNLELDHLYAENEDLASSIKNQAKVIKMILNSGSYKGESLLEYNKENIKHFYQISTQINNNTKNLLISNQIIIMTLLIDDLNKDITPIINLINDGKHASTNFITFFIH